MTRFAYIAPLFLCSACTTQGLRPQTIADNANFGSTVQLSDIFNNIKCDAAAFLKDNPKVKSFSMGGTITFTWNRSLNSDVSGGVKIPVVSKVSLEADLARERSTTFGDERTIPFVTVIKADEKWIETCKENGAHPIPVNHNGQTETINGHLLGISTLRPQFANVQTGNPFIDPQGFHIKGSMAFTESTKGGGKINVFIVQAGGSRTFKSEAKIDYDIGTNYATILKDLMPSAPEAPDVSTSVKPTQVVRHGRYDNDELKAKLILVKIAGQKDRKGPAVVKDTTGLWAVQLTEEELLKLEAFKSN